jgi:hypothetical protein
LAEEWLDGEFNEIKQTIAAEKAITVPGWGIMFTVPQWRTRLMHGVAVQVFTQLSGISMSIWPTSLLQANISEMSSAITKSSCTKHWDSQVEGQF